MQKPKLESKVARIHDLQQQLTNIVISASAVLTLKKQFDMNFVSPRELDANNLVQRLDHDKFSVSKQA